MLGSLYAGISGLNSNMTSMSVIGDNIANVNTVAFKNNMAIFSNVLSQAMGGGGVGMEIGRGAQLSIISEGWSQGALESTGNGTDMAVNGRGFFICKDDAGLPYYTRAGVFKFDQDGYLVNPQGMIVQGFSVDPQGNLGSITDVRINASTFQPSATQQMTTTMNLDADATDGHARLTYYGSGADSGVVFRAVNAGVEPNGYTITIDNTGAQNIVVTGNAVTITVPPSSLTAEGLATWLNDPANWPGDQLFTVTPISDNPGNTGTSEIDVPMAATNMSGGDFTDVYSTTINAYDSLGSSVFVTLDFTRTETGWDWEASTSSGRTTTTGTLTFTDEGILIPPATNPVIDITGLDSGAEDLSVEWAIIGNDTITGFASPSVTSFQSQDGYPAGTLMGVSVDEEGFVTGIYENGEVTSMFQIALADFQSYDGLDRKADSLYTESRASGQATPGKPGQGRLGLVSPESLEMSNVDLAREFVKMMTTQRAFQANSRVISTSDEILSELINLKR